MGPKIYTEKLLSIRSKTDQELARIVDSQELCFMNLE